MYDRSIEPGSTIGILGGGQLARMLAIAAAQLGLKAHIYAPPGDNPAFEVAAHHTIGAYDDAEVLGRFAATVAAVTYEFENVPAETVAAIEPHCPVRPNGRALAVSQDRLTEKRFMRELALETAPFEPVDDAASLVAALERLGTPAILKTRRFGYDGKGQIRLHGGEDPGATVAAIGGPAILEGFVPFSREVSAVVARTPNGAVLGFDLAENRHSEGILRRSTVPAGVRPETAEAAQRMAAAVAEALDYVGVLAVEFFVVEDSGGERLVVNEMAPRVHNSGHWTIEGAVTSQFTQHIRAICGWPLGSVRRLGRRVTMVNLIGADADGWRARLADPDSALHLYGKAETRAGRKMGHVTTVEPFAGG